MSAKLKWQALSSLHVDDGYGRQAEAELHRAAIPGGWLVRMNKWQAGYAGMGGLTFVPDPEHAWDGGSVERDDARK